MTDKPSVSPAQALDLAMSSLRRLLTHPVVNRMYQDTVDAELNYIERLRAPSRATPEEGKAFCLDCGRDYDDFGMDVLLPRWQWLIIHPDEGGLLCAQCIVTRASKLPGAVGLQAVIGIVPASRATSAPVTVVTVSPTELMPVGEALQRLRAQASRTMAGSGKHSAAYSLAAFVIDQVEQIESAVSDQIEAADKFRATSAPEEPQP